MPRHFLSILDFSTEEAVAVLARAMEMKQEGFRGEVLSGRTAAMLFEKHSTRTRVSFEVAVRQLGGETIFMTPADSQLGRSEPLKDTARVLSRYVDMLIVRTFGQEKLDELAAYGSIPVVNALSDLYHPCQVMSDVMTMAEIRPDLEGVKVAWIGDGNNMAHSWINAAARFPFELVLAAPEGYDPDSKVVERARELGARVSLTRDPEEAAKGAHFLNTDVWASMGQETEQAERAADMSRYRIDAKIMSLAAEDARFMHCLPAHRGEEVAEEVFEGAASIVWDQAENRLHMQKAVLETLWEMNRNDQGQDLNQLPSEMLEKAIV